MKNKDKSWHKVRIYSIILKNKHKKFKFWRNHALEILGNQLDVKPEKIKQGEKGLNLFWCTERKEMKKKKERKRKKEKKEKEEKREILHSLEIFIFGC